MEEVIVIMVGKVLAVLGLVAANGFFVASEFALVGVRRTRIDEPVAQGIQRRSRCDAHCVARNVARC